MKNKNKSGFMLMELMFVIVILGIVTAHLLPKYRNTITRTKEAQCLATRTNVEKAAQLYLFEHEDAISLPDFQTLITENYLDKYPRCTANGSYIWTSTAPLKLMCSIHSSLAIAVEPEISPLFTSDFDDMSGLTILKGKWEINDGVLHNQKFRSQILIDDGPWEDYSITANAKLDSGNGYGIYYRASLDSKEKIDGYIFQYDPGRKDYFVVRKITDGKESDPIAKVSMPSDFPIYDQYHQIEISVQGDSHEISIDGESILSFNDSSFDSGTSGFKTFNNTSAYFDEVLVNPL